MDATKTCNKCKEEKPLDEFYKDKSVKDGHTRICKRCIKQRDKDNAEQIKAYRARRYKAESEKQKEYVREWQQNNAERVQSNGKRWREDNVEKIKESRKEYYQDNIDKVKAANKQRYEDFPEKGKAASKKWAEDNSERKLENHRKWHKQNPSKRAAYNAQHRAAKINRTPPWADKEAIDAIYEEARALQEATGIPHHVDHIYPLRGEKVSGLHVEGNLRAVPAKVNLTKSNTFEPA